MIYISEEESAAMISHEIAYEAARAALVAAISEEGRVFPAVLGRSASPANTFSIKSGSSQHLTGVKVGSFWAKNPERGLPRHNSTIVLLDQEIGRLSAVVEAGTVNAYRTSAADAVAADLLARPDAKTLTIFGAGNQAYYEVTALARIRPIEIVHVVARPSERRDAFVKLLEANGLKIHVSPVQEAVSSSDIVVAATPSREALFDASWVRPGTHVASMGSDAPGKHELPTELLLKADLFCDLPSQSITIGDYQHVRNQITNGDISITPIGDVISKNAPGRKSDTAITVFDSSGIALQDLYIADALIKAKMGNSML
ncbi:ornithine cyclodeaminase family protein [Phyllobacterium phragmitis]|uniref:Ornithine cyclodeaminase family protein n=1 Tax=Phyllobacterium phragmitis TaxID=2670329 RepID=A0A2S9ISX5_9HYPH|nr:ornithine cyclodeaminase family protein [Phyllobacterium phragmitis]PRD43590.1 ornithine cyclodeaminase family protein [Phyllobacterium phragmitis]